jgi:hypothetical protein
MKVMTYNPTEDIMMDEFPMVAILASEDQGQKTRLRIKKASLNINERYGVKTKPRYLVEMKMSESEYREFLL